MIRPDLVPLLPINTISVMLGQPGGGFGAETRFRALTFAQDIAVGNLNGDTDPDLAVLGSGRVVILLGGTGVTFGPPTRVEYGQEAVAALSLSASSTATTIPTSSSQTAPSETISRTSRF